MAPPAFAELPPLPEREGLAGTFAGVSHGSLLVAGGSNFPGKKPWEGGTKQWHNAVYVLDKPDGEWKKAGTIPVAVASGVSATFRNRVLCVGGGDASKHYTEAFALEWINGELKRTALPPLPKPLCSAAGALVGDTLFVAGGYEKPDAKTASNAVYSLDLAKPDAKWFEEKPLPDDGRVLPSALVIDDALIIVGGAKLTDGQRTYLKTSFRRMKDGWKPIAELPWPAVAACTVNDLLLGGDDGIHFSIKPKADHPGFRKEILRYDPAADRWSTVGEWPNPRVVLPAVKWNDRFVLVSGEIRPGVRSPAVTAFQPARLR